MSHADHGHLIHMITDVLWLWNPTDQPAFPRDGFDGLDDAEERQLGTKILLRGLWWQNGTERRDDDGERGRVEEKSEVRPRGWGGGVGKQGAESLVFVLPEITQVESSSEPATWH